MLDQWAVGQMGGLRNGQSLKRMHATCIYEWLISKVGIELIGQTF